MKSGAKSKFNGHQKGWGKNSNNSLFPRYSLTSQEKKKKTVLPNKIFSSEL